MCFKFKDFFKLKLEFLLFMKLYDICNKCEKNVIFLLEFDFVWLLYSSGVIVFLYVLFFF